ncbi:MAG: lipase maturation factor family protein [Terrimicrobiaceae bacterium]
MPEKPLLIYDGECRFCCRWIEAWKAITGDRVDYETSRNAVARFPEIAPGKFADAVQWVGADGRVCSGAEAVFSALATATWHGRMALGIYREVPALARVADALYDGVATHRSFFSLLTRMLWGNDVRPPAYAVSGWLFLRILGGIFLVAFLSFGAQIDGLIGPEGILPAAEFFRAVRDAAGGGAFQECPSLLWWTGAGEAALHGWCRAGVVSSVLLMAGIAPAANLVFLWAVYLSLSMAGQEFYRFQWDVLLLETGFLAVFLAPWQWRAKKASPPPRLAHFLLLWLLFRLLFESGVVKLSGGDPAWANGTALDYHYFTQPLPTPTAWFAQQLPGWFQWLSVKATLFIEIVLPFLLFFPRRLRLLGAGGIALLQALIAVTGNYGIFNLLTLALCLLAVDDSVWGGLAKRVAAPDRRRFLPGFVLGPTAAAIVLLGLVPMASAFRQPLPWMEPLARAYATVQPFRTINGYGLFAVMTTKRREIIVQGSDDGVNWKTYGFRYKPGPVRRAPPWVAPYMPRLDWQMWFAALGGAERTPWFKNFLVRLLRGSAPVLDLLGDTPSFAGGPPRYVRAVGDGYEFTSPAERENSGDWWKTEPLSICFPAVSLKDR